MRSPSMMPREGKTSNHNGHETLGMHALYVRLGGKYYRLHWMCETPVV